MADTASKLGLGGHSFIGALGNDPMADFDEQCAIVTRCLDRGIAWFDTTYYQERVALGQILRTIGRRPEAKVIAWNFFRQPGAANELFSYTPYQPSHLDEMLAELQTDFVDLLVIHAHDDTERLQQEIALVAEWRRAGKVGGLGLGIAEPKHLTLISEPANGFSAVLAPYNAFHQSASALFSHCAALSIDTFAMSPFIRGWRLDQAGVDPAAVADLLLRWVTSQEIVDHVLVSMRRAAWVDVNLASERAGGLTASEAGSVAAWTRT